MVQRHVHYEQAFEHYLRSNGVPYVAVDEARRAIADGSCGVDADRMPLKSFDFVVYHRDGNVLLDVKGRRSVGGRYESWVTQDDVESLTVWQRLFGDRFEAVFAFVYWCVDQPRDGLFEDVFCFGDRWYVMRLVGLEDYRRCMRRRSERWRTLSVGAADFRRIARPCQLHRSGRLEMSRTE